MKTNRIEETIEYLEILLDIFKKDGCYSRFDIEKLQSLIDDLDKILSLL